MVVSVLKRLASLVPVLLGITLLAFILGQLAPGDPAEEALKRIGVELPTEQELADMRQELGLDQPLMTQYVHWLGKIVRGDFGTSYFTKRPIGEELARRFPATLKLALSSALLATVFGIGAGILMCLFPKSPLEYGLRGLCLLLLSIPGFLLAVVSIILFSEHLKWLPTSGTGGLKHMVLPSLVLSSATTAITARVARGAILTELGTHYALTATSKGLSERWILIRHALPNALIPLIALLGNYFGAILGGAAVIESIFALPGIGAYVLTAITGRDYPVVQGFVIYSGFIYVLITLCMDLLYAVVNPKIRLSGHAK